MKRNSFLAVMNAGLEFFMGLLLMLFTTRFYDLSHTGRWFLFTAVVSMLGMMRDALIQSALIRDTAHVADRHHAILKTNLAVMLIVEVIIAFAAFSFDVFFTSSWGNWILLIPAYSITNALYRWQVFYLRGQILVSSIAWSNVIQFLIQVIGVALVFVNQWKIEAIVWVTIASQLAATLYCSRSIPYIKVFSARFDRTHLMTIKQFGIYAMGRESLSAVSTRFSLFITETYLTLTQTSILGISQRFSQIALLPNNAFQSLLLPQLVVSAREKNLKQLHDRLYKGLAQLFLITIPASLVGIALAPMVLAWMIPGEYAGAWIYISIYTLIGIIITPFGSAFGSIVTALGKPHLAFRLVAINSILNCTLSFILIYQLGIVGAPLSMLIVEVVGWCSVYIILRRQAEIDLFITFTYMIKLIKVTYVNFTNTCGTLYSEMVVKFKV